MTHGGDTAEMVAARATLLGAGHYAPLAAAIVDAAAAAPDASGPATAAPGGTRRPPGLAVDVGAGTGHYLASLLDARPADVGLALDVSKAALRRAAGAHPRLAAVRADAWRRLPVADGAAGLVLDVFAPRSGAEFHRILRPDGALVVATPTPAHLRELVDAAGLVTVDPEKEERLASALEPWFTPAGSADCTWSIQLSPGEARALVAMGPSARHRSAEQIAAGVARLGEPVALTGSVRVSIWRPRLLSG